MLCEPRRAVARARARCCEARRTSGPVPAEPFAAAPRLREQAAGLRQPGGELCGRRPGAPGLEGTGGAAAGGGGFGLARAPTAGGWRERPGAPRAGGAGGGAGHRRPGALVRESEMKLSLKGAVSREEFEKLLTELGPVSCLWNLRVLRFLRPALAPTVSVWGAASRSLPFGRRPPRVAFLTLLAASSGAVYLALPLTVVFALTQHLGFVKVR